ncbi:hypothetical protein RJT34_23778 [Clitoria ternatea]|uniref:Dof zinc finger protein n=1 Tax=Clitoria ternatea TaxID=43366 RepID=A0AAN9FLQ6_CLITE
MLTLLWKCVSLIYAVCFSKKPEMLLPMPLLPFPLATCPHHRHPLPPRRAFVVVMENGWKPEVEISPNCPRCGSSNTKFCYYNNYSLTQPRYFCKGCRRYWTKGGSLRNVPVGGGCRKNRRGNKTLLRQSIDGFTFKNNNSPTHHHSSNNTNPVVGHSNYDPAIRTTCSTSSSSSDGPNIDLALVYANFLNQKPNSEAGPENINQVQSTVFDPSQEIGPPSALAEELGNASNQVCYSDQFNSMQTLIQKDAIDNQQCSSQGGGGDGGLNFELPPLPGEEEVSHDHHMMWSDSDEMMMNHVFQVTQEPPPLLGPHQVHDADLLIGNWSPFDSPRGASFSRP